VVRAEEKCDRALTIKVVKIGEMALSGFVWTWQVCFADFRVRLSFSKPLFMLYSVYSVSGV